MAKYVFSPWDPIRKKGDTAEDVAQTIATRTKEWNEERRKKGKKESELYIPVYWTGDGGYVVGNKPVDDGKKITLQDGDQIYIKGHYQAGLTFIADITKREDERIRKQNQGIRRENRRIRKENKRIQQANEPAELKKIIHRTRPMRPLDPAELARRLSGCFEASETFNGKIKFYNCSSGVDGGEGFAKPAAGLLRACWPDALYIGYQDDLSQQYGDYHAEQKTERRKLGMKTRKRAKDLQVIIEKESEEDSYSSDEDSGSSDEDSGSAAKAPGYLVPDLDDLREAALGINFDIQEFHL
jgi:hypothetical protein